VSVRKTHKLPDDVRAKRYPVSRNPRGVSPDPNSLHEESHAAQTLRKFGDELGASKIIDMAQACDDLTPEEERFLNHLADPRNDLCKLDEVCREVNFKLGDFFKLLKKSRAAEAMMRAHDEIYSKVPLVAKDVMDRSVPHRVLCKTCWGTGGLEDGETSIKCKPCRGSGFVDVLPELERQKVALTIGGLLKTGGGVQVNTQINTAIQVPRSTTEWRAATDRLLYPQREVAAEVKIEKEAPSGT